MKACPSCGNQNEDAAVFCDNCGSNMGAGAPPPVNVPAANLQMGAPPAQAGGGNIVCPTCGTPNMPGTMYCDNCGADLKNLSAGGPAPQPAQPQWQPQQAQPPVQPQWLQQVQPPPAMGPTPPRIMAGGMPLMVPQKAELVIGRSDVASGWMPDVDLTPAGGTAEQGVSRRHAKLTWQNQWLVEDMDSVNKTYLRGQALVPFQKVPINNGEVIQMGRVQVTFYSS